MRKAGLWTAVAALVLLGLLMFATGLTVTLAPITDEPTIASDPKLRQMLEEQRRRREREEYKIEVQYLTMAALEFTVAAFLAGKARRS
jgi:hypothetical protein